MNIETIASKVVIYTAFTAMVIVMFGVLFGSHAMGADFNFIVNNTEQGDNSKANPTLTVSGKEYESSGEGSKETFTSLPTQSTQSSKEEIQDLQVDTTKRPRWRVSGSAIALKPAFSQKFSVNGASLGVGYSVVDEFVLHGYYGHGLKNMAVAGVSDSKTPQFVGLDAEILPIRLSVAQMENLLEAGVLVGLSSLLNSSAPVSVHYGARVLANVGKAWGLSAGVRYSDERYLIGDVGLAIRL